MSRKRIVTEETIEKIKELTAKKYGAKEIAAICGIGKSTVTYYQRELNLRDKKNMQTLTTGQVNKILTMSTHRYTQARIAEEIGCSIQTVRRYQQANGIPASNRDEASGWTKKINAAKKEAEEKRLSKMEPKEIKMPENTVEGDICKYEAPRSSGRYPFGTEEPSNVVELSVKPVEEIKEVVPMTQKIENKPAATDISNSPRKNGSWINVVNADIEIKGNDTGFSYTFGLSGNDIIINSNSFEEMKLDVKDLAAFGNELIDIAEKITTMRQALLGA